MVITLQENNAIIGQHEMVNKVVEIVQERQDMASSLRVSGVGWGWVHAPNRYDLPSAAVA